MTEEKKEEVVTEDPKAAEPSNTDSNDIGPIPYARFKEVNDARRELENRLAELEKLELARQSDAEKAKLERMKEQEKFQELAEEMQGKYEALKPQHDELKAQLEAHQETLEKYAEAQIGAVPELFREVVGRMPLLERLQWLTDNLDKLDTKQKPSGIPATPEGVNRPDLKDEDRRQRAARTF